MDNNTRDDDYDGVPRRRGPPSRAPPPRRTDGYDNDEPSDGYGPSRSVPSDSRGDGFERRSNKTGSRSNRRAPPARRYPDEGAEDGVDPAPTYERKSRRAPPRQPPTRGPTSDDYDQRGPQMRHSYDHRDDDAPRGDWPDQEGREGLHDRQGRRAPQYGNMRGGRDENPSHEQNAQDETFQGYGARSAGGGGGRWREPGGYYDDEDYRPGYRGRGGRRDHPEFQDDRRLPGRGAMQRYADEEYADLTGGGGFDPRDEYEDSRHGAPYGGRGNVNASHDFSDRRELDAPFREGRGPPAGRGPPSYQQDDSDRDEHFLGGETSRGGTTMRGRGDRRPESFYGPPYDDYDERTSSRAAEDEDDDSPRGSKRDAQMERRLKQGGGGRAASEDGHGPHSRSSKSASSPGGFVFQDFETAPAGGSSDQMVQCLIVRDRSGLKRMNPEYMLYLQNGRKKGHEKLILIARKQQHKSGCSYHIYNVSRGHLGGRLKKKGGNYIGKLKSTNNRVENVMYNNEERKEELGAVLFEKPTIIDHMKDGAQPRKLRILLPPIDHDRKPIAHRVSPSDPFGGLVAALQSDNVNQACTLLERKEPVFENGNYRLNFHGRVTVPSVKNFQLVDPMDVDEVICQFGKVHDDRFHLDFKGPMNAFQAFCVALSQFNY